MHITAIIAEYNPFHSGHRYQIEQARQLGADQVLVLMSPDFVQRGEPALADKYTRAHMALLGGADVVLELPSAAALGGADHFARGACLLLEELGCVDSLCFGCEQPDAGLMEQAADILISEPADFRNTLQTALRSGCSFPAAREEALWQTLPHPAASSREHFHEWLSSPNNLLALEYVKALRLTGSSIKPLPIQRRGMAYHDMDLPTAAGPENEPVYPSASALRQQLMTCPQDKDLLAGESYMSPLRSSLARRLAPGSVYDAYDRYLQHTVWEKTDLLENFADVSDVLAGRIRRYAFNDLYTSAELVNILKTKDLTAARIRRALLHIFLDLRAAQVQAFFEPDAAHYLRLLGFKKTSAPLLHKIKVCSSIPIISKSADASVLLPPDALSAFMTDVHAGAQYAFLEGRPDFASADLRRSPVIL